jgi:hypothetical protein
MPEHRRGRPTFVQTYYGDKACVMEAAWHRANFKLNAVWRAISTAYRFKKRIQESPYIETICRIDDNEPWYSRSILAQLGRVILQDGYGEADVIAIAKVAAQALHGNYTVKLDSHHDSFYTLSIGRK